jgi:triosephosphate isomerase
MPGGTVSRRPFALANWKMAMTIPQSLAFVREFLARAGPYLEIVEIVLCPPYTALAAVATAVKGTPIAVGGQDLWPGPDQAQTGAISAELLADAGAPWVMVGHWEVRRRLREDDRAVNRKVRAALEGNLRPILFFGEAAGEPFAPGRLAILLDGCDAGAVARMAFVYEPEGAIGQAEPVSPAHAAAGCRAIRRWLADRFGEEAAGQARIIYGGSVTPEHAAALLADPDVDGLGATRRGRDPAAFAEIVAQIAARR